MNTIKSFYTALFIMTLCLISCSGEDGEQGAAGENGISCWDINGDGLADMESEDVNQDGKVNALDCMGQAGDIGANGINCWDLDGNGEADVESEDINGDDVVNVLDCMGLVGDTGANGTNCWDLNGNGEGDLDLEDINGDGEVDVLDCSGADGNDIEVLEDFTEYGSITIELEGTRPDGVPFQDNLELKLVGTLTNNTIRDFQGNGYDQTISFSRYLPLGNNGFEDVWAGFSLSTLDLGEDPQAIKSARFSIRHYIFGDDNKYFVLDASFNLFDLDENNNEQDGSEVGTSNVDLTDVVYDANTQRLSFSYSFTGAAANNNSDHDLNVSGAVDVVLFEQVN